MISSSSSIGDGVIHSSGAKFRLSRMKLFCVEIESISLFLMLFIKTSNWKRKCLYRRVVIVAFNFDVTIVKTGSGDIRLKSIHRIVGGQEAFMKKDAEVGWCLLRAKKRLRALSGTVSGIPIESKPYGIRLKSG